MSSKSVNISKVDMYMNILEPLDLNLKLELLNRLSDSIRKVITASAEKEPDSVGFNPLKHLQEVSFVASHFQITVLQFLRQEKSL